MPRKKPLPPGGGFLVHLSLLNAGGMLLLWLSHVFLAERFWLPTLLAYIPQYPYDFPTLALLGLCGWRRRWGLWVFNLAVLGFWLFALLGWAVPKPTPAGTAQLRVMTYNIRMAELATPKALAQSMLAQRPDVIFLQETRRGVAEQLSLYMGGWYWSQAGEVAIFSRTPLEDIRIHPMPGNPRRILQARTHTAGHTLTLVSVHYIASTLLNRRTGGIRTDTYRSEAQIRALTTQLLLNIARQSPFPVVLAGDFNTPPRVGIYHQLRQHLQDAFVQAGRGLGYSYSARSPLLRIDYIWVSSQLTPLRTWLLPSLESDHLPLLTDLSLE